ncbi:MAG: GC-type dockerin domain-anchored protein [Phycisphaerales bacterium]|jgi:hypothetical protein|nr:GC-type dockerin domain-anchored protein [Phycisphaerales bacterium]
MLGKKAILAFFGAGPLLVGAANARADVFADRTAFDAANPGLNLIDFEGLVSEFDFLPVESVGPLSFDADGIPTPNIALLGSGIVGTTSTVLAQTVFFEPLRMVFAEPVQAAGFDLSLYPAGFPGVTLSGQLVVDVFSGTDIVETVAYDAATMPAYELLGTFVGFSNLGDITAIRITLPSEQGPLFAALIDNVSFGSVPAPGTLGVLAAGGIAAARRRRNTPTAKPRAKAGSSAAVMSIAVAGSMLAAASPAMAQCEPSLLTSPNPGNPGLFHNASNNDVVFALEEFNGELYAGGIFNRANGAIIGDGIARWDGTTWRSVAGGASAQTGSNPAQIDSMIVWDDGTGPALYVAGDFTFIGGVEANGIAKWNGTSWHALGDGIKNLLSGNIHWATFGLALEVFDDGNGEQLYVAGQFNTAGGITANHIARWNGNAWSTVPGADQVSMLNPFHLLVHDDGSGPSLYMAGVINSVGGTPARNIVRWDGAVWHPLGDGTLPGPGDATIEGLTSFDDGTGPKLYAVGWANVNGVSRWDGSSWEVIYNVQDAFVRAVTKFDDGNGEALYCVAPNRRLLRWNGSAWDTLYNGIGGTFGGEYLVMKGRIDVNGPQMFVGGNFTGTFSDGVEIPTVNIASITLCVEDTGCAADWDGDTNLNSSDFLAYLNDFASQDPAADIAPPGGDGSWNSSDFLAYLNLYAQGC